MIELQMQITDELAERIFALEPWLSTVLELSLIGFQTSATATATEMIQFLAKSPTSQDILAFHVSDRAQDRLKRLLTLNDAGLLSESEKIELDELEQIEHVVIMLKAQVAENLRQN